MFHLEIGKIRSNSNAYLRKLILLYILGQKRNAAYKD